MQSDELVRQITAEVLRRMGAGAPAAPPPAAPATAPSGGRALVLLTGGDARVDLALADLERLSRRHARLRVVLSATAQQLIGMPAVRRAAPAAEVHTDGEPRALLEGVEAVYLPNLSLNAAAKIGRLTPDSLVCILAVRALLGGLPVKASRDSLLPQGSRLSREA